MVVGVLRDLPVSVGVDGLQIAPTKPLNGREELPEGGGAEQMKLTWSATGSSKGMLPLYGSLPRNDREEC